MSSIAEPAIAISVICIAHLRPFLAEFFPKRWFAISGEPLADDIVTFGRLRAHMNDNNTTNDIRLDSHSEDEKHSASVADLEQLQKKGHKDLELDT